MVIRNRGREEINEQRFQKANDRFKSLTKSTLFYFLYFLDFMWYIVRVTKILILSSLFSFFEAIVTL